MMASAFTAAIPYPAVGISNGWEPHTLEVDGVLLYTGPYLHGMTSWQCFGVVRAEVPYRPERGLVPLLLELAARAREKGGNAVLGLDVGIDPWAGVASALGSAVELRAVR